MYLSYDSMLNLGILNLAFMDVGKSNKLPLDTTHITVVRDVNDGWTTHPKMKTILARALNAA